MSSSNVTHECSSATLPRSTTELSKYSSLPIAFTKKFQRDISHYIDVTCNRSSEASDKVMVVYEGQGNEDGNCSHSGVLQSVIRSLKLREKGWDIRIYNCKIIRQYYPEWTHPKFLVDALLSSTIHIILCQGIHSGMVKIWHTRDCVEELTRLEYHPGFPFGKKLRCPAFTGDKMNYLYGAHKHTMPSFMVALNGIEARNLEMFSQANTWGFHKLQLSSINQ